MTAIQRLDSDALLELLVDRRWFAASGQSPESAEVAAVVYADHDLELALVDVRFAEGTHSTYLLALAADGEDALEHPAALARLAALAGIDTPGRSSRVIGVEQSNSSVVIDESIVLKLYRRLEPGPSPEVEVLRALESADFAWAPRLRGVIEHEGEPLSATLAVAVDYIPSAGGGWELTLDSIQRGNPDWLPGRAGRLGEVTGQMHAALATSEEPHLVPEEASSEAVALLAATLDEEVVRIASDLPLLEETPLGARIGELRDRIQDLAHSGPPGRVIRIHGDFHLGQVLWSNREDWAVIDFEGEPGRSLIERRRRNFALKDVAGMLRSFAYAADASGLLGSARAPAGWEEHCRAAFLEGWRSTVANDLLPSSEPGLEHLLMLFELQKLLYELRYELANRPDWVAIPIAGLERMLEQS